MTASTKSFLWGAFCAALVLGAAGYVFVNLRDAAIRSKSKRLFVDAMTVGGWVDQYRKERGGYPESLNQIQAPSSSKPDCDYFSNGRTYTLVCPAYGSKLKWQPYVFRDGALVSWPPYMNEEPFVQLAARRQ